MKQMSYLFETHVFSGVFQNPDLTMHHLIIGVGSNGNRISPVNLSWNVPLTSIFNRYHIFDTSIVGH